MSEKQKPVELAIKNDNGMVIIQLSRLVNYVEIDPDNALKIAEAITDSAFEAMHKVKPLGDTLKAALVEKHREKLIPRISLMLKGMNNLSDGQKSIKIVDAVCSEVFS